ncbi:MAG TPA: hydroxymethylbilane synthase [Acidimicrobiales bacterium]|nr:hydroxymethylbilane synthase [Acidimicrobiales bacterium]
MATRRSPLARRQAETVAARLAAANPGLDVTLVFVETTGDRRADRPLWEIGGQGVFVKEVQAAVADGRADAAVHSAKDLPSRAVPGLALAAVPERADPRDVLVGSTLEGLPPGATVATGSVRRRAQLAWLRPDLTFTGLRGNIATRLERIPRGGAVVVAAAALDRLDLEPAAAERLEPSVMLPQVGQGCIAVECRDSDEATLEALAEIDDPLQRMCLDAERAFLARLEGGCDLPAGALALPQAEGGLRVEGLLASLDGRVLLRSALSGTDPSALGTALAEELLTAGPALMGRPA